MHEKNIAHRDIKLDNVLLAEGGIPKIVDLGFGMPCTMHSGAPSPRSPSPSPSPSSSGRSSAAHLGRAGAPKAVLAGSDACATLAPGLPRPRGLHTALELPRCAGLRRLAALLGSDGPRSG